MKKYIIYLGVLLVGAVIGWLCRSPRPKEVAETQRDTVFVRDTVREYYPVEVVKETKETIQVAVTDTVRVHDTLYMNLQTEKKIYRGEDYYAEVSGYRPSLDRIDVYPKTTTITQTITQSAMRRNYLSLGLEVSYTDKAYIPLYLQYSYLPNKNVEMYARVLYDIPTRLYGFGLGAKVGIGW